MKGTDQCAGVKVQKIRDRYDAGVIHVLQTSNPFRHVSFKKFISKIMSSDLIVPHYSE